MTHMRCGGIFNKYFAANLLENFTAGFLEGVTLETQASEARIWLEQGHKTTSK